MKKTSQLAIILPVSSPELHGNSKVIQQEALSINKSSLDYPRIFYKNSGNDTQKETCNLHSAPALNKGFTLVELAIVIVIIGILVGGVLQGQELIRSSNIHSTIKDLESFRSAYHSFKDKYNCYPGDCINARTFFNSIDCPDVSGNSCNGNGDNLISANGSNNTENARFWQHLSLAKFIKGTYQGYYNGTGSNYLGIVVPKSSIKGVGYGVFSGGVINHIRIAGVLEDNLQTRIDPRKLTSYEASIIDDKLDDGLPNIGRLAVNYSISSSCASATAYLKTDTAPNCVISFTLE